MKRLSLKFKLTLIIILATFIVTFTGFVFIIMNEIDLKKDDLNNKILTNVKIIGEICVSPLSFNDRVGATDLLNKLLTLPEILDCHLYDKDKKIFAKIKRSEIGDINDKFDDIASGEYVNGILNIIHPIEYMNIQYGWIYVRASTKIYDQQIHSYLIKMAFIFAFMLIFAFLLAIRLQKIISKPIMDLAKVSNIISKDQNYSVRVKNDGSDEIAFLYGEFNEMLSQIENRSKERDKAENELYLYKKMVSATNESMTFIDSDYTYLAVNDAYLNLFEVRREEVIGHHASDIVGKEAFEKASKKILDKCLMKGESVSFEGWLDFPTLGKRFAKVNSYPYKEKNKDISGVVTVSSDVTERRLVEEALERERNFTERALDSQIDTFFVFDPSKGKAIRWNKRFRDMSGYSDEEIKQLKVPDAYYSEDDISKAVASIKETDRSGYSRVELFFICKEGQKIPTEYFVSKFKDEKGESEFYILIGRDITERKKSEKAIIEIQRLGAIGEMASSIAHDFNNSLQAILGNLELILLKKEVPEEIIEKLNVVKMAADDAASRIELLQRFGGKKQTKSQYKLIELNSLISDVITQSRPLWKDAAEKKGLNFSVESKYSDIPDVFGNEGELRSVIYNIIKNAIESMPNGGQIDLITEKSEKGVDLSIIDNGIGMSEEIRSRIFQPFYSTKGFELGKGLGMSGAYSIMQEHNGEIFVEDTSPGKGTTIKIVLPYTEEEEKNEEDVAPETQRSIKILWVDDDRILRNIAKEYIIHLGHTGDVTGSALEALELLEKNQYDLILTDLGMPDMNGWELADEINKRYNGKLQVAVVTGWGEQIGDEERKKYNVNHVIGKPTSLEELQKLIGKII